MWILGPSSGVIERFQHKMSVATPAPLKKTPLHATHVAAGARMVPFGGWDMPVEYSGISDEHMAVRERAGVFDVSHMGEIEVAGPDALRAVQAMTCNDASRLSVGQAQYSALTTPAGTFIDDVLVYRWAESHYLFVVNASNVSKAGKWIAAEAARSGGDVDVVNSSARYALIAVQGPAASDVLRDLVTVDLDSLKYYWFAPGEVAGVRAMISRTGYTGELGFELFVAPAEAARVWNAVVAAGRQVDIRPCGLGARDTLRLEACMRLYGNEMDESVSVLEAGLEWIVAWGKGPFNGREALELEKQRGSTRTLVAFEMRERAIARPGYAVLGGDTPCGRVTSGTQTPFLKKAIGLALVPTEMSALGADLTIDIRGRRAQAVVVPEPFYRRPKTAAGVRTSP